MNRNNNSSLVPKQQQQQPASSGSILAVATTSKNKQIIPGFSTDDLNESPNLLDAIKLNPTGFKTVINSVSKVFRERVEDLSKKPSEDTIDITVMPNSIDVWEKTKFASSSDGPKITAMVCFIDRGLPKSDSSTITNSAGIITRVALPQRCYLCIGGMDQSEVTKTLNSNSKLFSVHHIFDYLDGLRKIAINEEKKKQRGSKSSTSSTELNTSGDINNDLSKIHDADEQTQSESSKNSIDPATAIASLDAIPDVLINSALPSALKSTILKKCILRHAPTYHIMTLEEQATKESRTKTSAGPNSTGKEPQQKHPTKISDSAALKKLVVKALSDKVIAEIVCATYAEWVDCVTTKRDISINSSVAFKSKGKSLEFGLHSFAKLYGFQASCAIQPLEIADGSRYVKKIQYFTYNTAKQDNKVSLSQLYDIFMGIGHFSTKYLSIDQILFEAKNLVSSQEYPNLYSALRKFDLTVPIVPSDGPDANYWLTLKGKNNTPACVFTIPVDSKSTPVLDQWCTQKQDDKNPKLKLKTAAMRVPLYGASWQGQLITQNKEDGFWYVDATTLKGIQLSTPLWANYIKQLGFEPDKDFAFWMALAPRIAPNISAIAICSIDQTKSTAQQENLKIVWDGKETYPTAQAQFLNNAAVNEINSNRKLYKFKEPSDALKAVHFLINKQPDIALGLIVKAMLWKPNDIYRRIGIPISRKSAKWMLENHFTTGMTGALDSKEFGVINLSRQSEGDGNVAAVSATSMPTIDDCSPQAYDIIFFANVYDIPDSIKADVQDLNPDETDIIFCDEFVEALQDNLTLEHYFNQAKLPKDHVLRRIKFAFTTNFAEYKMILALKKPETDEQRNQMLSSYKSKLQQYSVIGNNNNANLLSAASPPPQNQLQITNSAPPSPSKVVDNNTTTTGSVIDFDGGEEEPPASQMPANSNDMDLGDVSTTAIISSKLDDNKKKQAKDYSGTKKGKGKEIIKENQKKRGRATTVNNSVDDDIVDSDDDDDNGSKNETKSPKNNTSSKKRKIDGKGQSKQVSSIITDDIDNGASQLYDDSSMMFE